MSDISTAFQPTKTKNISAWILQVLLVLVFLAAAGAKLASVPMLVEEFNLIGLGQWLRYVTAIVEITGAVALLTPRFSAYGALLLAITMFFATLVHLFALHNDPTPAIVLLVLNLAVLWLRRYQFNPRKYF
ncbi:MULTISPECIES: DoxX family protein [Methylotenera]|uniref:DoxX family protein n=1 Tax=Methylotenera TaxID=359407 RepID=UPI00035CA43C|nr:MULTISPECIES: DoxX family protein [Methylotenera]